MTKREMRAHAIYRAKQAYRNFLTRAVVHRNFTISDKMDAFTPYTWKDDNGCIVWLKGNGNLGKAVL